MAEQKRCLLKTLKAITSAAKLRVEGATWELVAQRIGRSSAQSAENITRQHPTEWQKAFLEARERYLSEVESEAVLTQRELLRPIKPAYDERGRPLMDEQGNRVMVERDDKIRQMAAHSLLNHAAKLYAQRLAVTGNVDVGVHALADLIHAANNGGFSLEAVEEGVAEIVEQAMKSLPPPPPDGKIGSDDEEPDGGIPQTSS